MAKQIVLTYEGKDYTLEFNRKIVKRMESNGFVAGDIGDMPVSGILTLFHGAFLKNHPHIRAEQTEAIWDAQRCKDKLLVELISMYTEPVASLMDETDADDENPTWKVV